MLKLGKYLLQVVMLFTATAGVCADQLEQTLEKVLALPVVEGMEYLRNKAELVPQLESYLSALDPSREEPAASEVTVRTLLAEYGFYAHREGHRGGGHATSAVWRSRHPDPG